jgi:hypothetical protein
MVTVSERPDYGAFIPSYLDDYPLKPCEFRVYARILRRAGTKGGHHWEGMPATAKACGMNVKTVRAAVRLLQAANMIVLHEIPGRPNDIQPTHHDQWVDSSQVETLRRTPTPTRITPTESGRGTRSGNPELGRTPLPREADAPTELGRTPLPREADEGNPFKVPIEGNPLKVDPPNPQGGKTLPAQYEAEQPSAEKTMALVVQRDHRSQAKEENASFAGAGGGKKSKPAIAVDVPAWVMSHNQNKPDGWAGCRGITPKGMEAVRAVIAFYGNDQALALESHALALQEVRINPRLRFWRDKSGDFMTAIYATKIDGRIAAWAESARAKGLNPYAVAASGMNESQIQQAVTAADPMTAKLLKLMAPRRAVSHG